MLLITRKSIYRLVQPYREPDMLACYAISQTISSPTSKAILLINRDRLKVLFLNVFSSKVVEIIDFALDDLKNQKLKSGMGLSAMWSFQLNGTHWRFSMIKKMLTLGSMQGDLLSFLNQHIVKDLG
ncbi:hypothetical protein MKY85_05385 [Paenibacillus sp. FSL R5-0749]|uniref:hypothetical protein n=1 Tax=Paenibacillus sp. FSL R5-0749 TaxID=2921657 RepID=UPI00315B13AB